MSSAHSFFVLVIALAGCSSSTTPAPSTTTVPSSDAGSSGGTTGGATALTGKLGALGAAKATVSSLWISNSGETLVYLSSAKLTCSQLGTSRWLGSAAAGSQIVEIVIPGAPKVGDVAVPPGEVNYAEGGKSSAYEQTADSGSITFTKADATTLEGRLTAEYADGNVAGSFHAEFCDKGQGY